MLVNATFFFGDIAIGQLNEQAVKDKVTMVVDHREPEYLSTILGQQLYKDLQTGLTTLPTVPQIWLDLKNGVEYTDVNGNLKKWNGLVSQGTIAKQSPIAYYVCYWFLRSEASKNTGTGEAILKGTNSDTVAPKQKMVTAWNEMVKWNIELCNFLNSKKADYPSWDNLNENYCERKKFFQKINMFNI